MSFPDGPFQMDAASVAVIQGRDHAGFTGLLEKVYPDNPADGTYRCVDPTVGTYGDVTVTLSVWSKNGGTTRFFIFYLDLFCNTDFTKLDPPPPAGVGQGNEPCTDPLTPSGFFWLSLSNWMGTNTIIVTGDDEEDEEHLPDCEPREVEPCQRPTIDLPVLADDTAPALPAVVVEGIINLPTGVEPCEPCGALRLVICPSTVGGDEPPENPFDELIWTFNEVLDNVNTPYPSRSGAGDGPTYHLEGESVCSPIASGNGLLDIYMDGRMNYAFAPGETKNFRITVTFTDMTDQYNQSIVQLYQPNEVTIAGEMRSHGDNSGPQNSTLVLSFDFALTYDGVTPIPIHFLCRVQMYSGNVGNGCQHRIGSQVGEITRLD
jgi:hypothetical protein